MNKLNVLNPRKRSKFLQVLDSSPLFFDSFSQLKGTFLLRNGLNSILEEGFLRENYVQYLSNAVLFDLKFVDWLDPWNVLFKEDDFAAGMNFFSL